jgi:hypothetical protein
MTATIAVCLNPYWNYVAVPYSLAILSFGIVTLFRLSSTQLTGDKLATSVKDVMTANLVSKENLQTAEGKEAIAVRGAVSGWSDRFARGRARLGAATRRAGQAMGAAARGTRRFGAAAASRARSAGQAFGPAAAAAASRTRRAGQAIQQAFRSRVPRSGSVAAGIRNSFT